MTALILITATLIFMSLFCWYHLIQCLYEKDKQGALIIGVNAVGMSIFTFLLLLKLIESYS